MFFYVILISLIKHFICQPNVYFQPKYYSGGSLIQAITLNNQKSAFYTANTLSGVISISKINVTNQSNFLNAGSYSFTGTQNTPFSQLYLLQNGYLLASSSASDKPRICNQSVFACVSLINWNGHFATGKQLESKGIFVFGSSLGHLGYFNISELPNPTLVFVFNDSSQNLAHIKVSPDQNLVAVAYEGPPTIRIFSTIDWSLLVSFSTSGLMAKTTEWSMDNRYLAVFPYDKTYMQVYDRSANWSLIKNLSHGYTNVSNCFLHKISNSIICWVESSNHSVFSINWYTYEVKLRNWTTLRTKMRYSSSVNWLGFYNPTSTDGNVADLSLLCPQGQWQDSTSFTCGICAFNCYACGSTSECAICMPNYQWVSGRCNPCSTYYPNIYYNTSTLVCQAHPSGFANPLPLIDCPADTFFSFDQAQCVQCDPNCVICQSTTICLLCAANFQLFDGTCQQCGPTTYYNATSLGCLDYLNLCSNGNYFNVSQMACVQCTTNCQTCSSTTQCSVCIFNYTLDNGACFTCNAGNYYNLTNSACQPCLSNCQQCTTSSSCISCLPSFNLVTSPVVSCISCQSFEIFNASTQACQMNCISNCLLCDSLTTCLTCDTGFVLNIISSCILYSTPVQPSNFTSNSTSVQPSNSTPVQPSNSTSNSTSVQPSNSTPVQPSNSTSNSTSVQPSNYTPQTSNYTVEQTGVYGSFISVMESQAVRVVNKIPANRIIFSNLLSYFINLDHLWLYIYHKRQYGLYIDKLFSLIVELENEKWNAISDQILIEISQVNLTQIASNIDFKRNISSQKYVRIEGEGRSFLTNSINYFLLNVPLVIIMFSFLKLLFHVTSKTWARGFFLDYGLNATLVLMLTEGNQENFTYLVMFDLLHFQYKNFKEKFLNVITLGAFWYFMIFFIAFYFLVKIHYKSKSQIIFGECKTTTSGIVNLTVHTGILNFCLGVCHLLLENHYQIQLKALALVESLHIFVIINFIRKGNFKLIYIGWVNLMASFFRVLLIFSFSIDLNLQSNERAAMDDVQKILINVHIVSWVLTILFGYIILAKSFVKFIASHFFKMNVKIPSNIKEKGDSLQKQSHSLVKLKTKQKAPLNNNKVVLRVSMMQNPAAFRNKKNNIKIMKYNGVARIDLLKLQNLKDQA